MRETSVVRQRPRWRVGIVALVGLLASSLAVGVAAAAQISVAPGHAPPGDTFSVTGSGFTPDFPPCRIYFESGGVSEQWATCTVTEDGTVDENVTVPAGQFAQEGQIRVCNYCGGGEFEESAEAPFTVDPAPAETNSPTPTGSGPTTPATTIPTSPTPSPRESVTATPSPAHRSSPSPTATRTPSTLSGDPAWLDIETPTLDGFLGTTIDSSRLRGCFPPEGATVHDFDNLYDGANPRAQPRFRDSGVRIRTTDGVWPDEVSVYAPVHGTFTPPNGVINATRSGDFGAVGDLRLEFDEPQSLVGMHVGTDETTAEPIVATLTAIDAAGAIVATATADIGAGPASVTHCMYVQQDPGPARISTVLVSMPAPNAEVIDHLFFAQEGPPAEVERPPLEIAFTQPSRILHDGRYTLGGTVRATTRPRTVAVVQTHSRWADRRLGSASVQADLRDPTLWWWTLPRAYLYADEDTQLIATAYHGRETAEAVLDIAEGGPPPPRRGTDGNFDLEIAAIEVTQGLRGPPFEITPERAVVNEPAVHVAGRPTVVRVWPRLRAQGPGAEVVNELTAVLSVSRGGTNLGVLGPEDGTIAARTSSEVSSARLDPTSSWNFVLPPSWTTEGSIDLTVTANPVWDPGWRRECDGCHGDATAHVLGVQFAQGAEVLLNPYLVDWSPRGDGGGIAAAEPEIIAAPTVGDLLEIVAGLQRVLPVATNGVRLGPLRTVPYAGPLETKDEEGDLVSWDIADAMIPRYLEPAGFTESDGRYRPEVNGFLIGGRGCGGRALFSYPFFHAGACPMTVVHEVVHTYGINHASNAHGEDRGGGFDDRFPGRCGQIAGRGVTVDARWVGTDVLSSPVRIIPADRGPGSDEACGSGHAHDFMSYGGHPEWISRTGWELVLDQLERTEPRLVRAGTTIRDADGGDAVVVAGSLDRSGTVRFAPLFPGAGQATPGVGGATHTVEVVDVRGNHVAVGVVLNRTEEAGFRTFLAIVPVEDAPRSVRLLADGEVLGELTASGGAPEVTITTPEGDAVWDGPLEIAWANEDPDGDGLTSLVEASADGGTTWVTVVADTRASSVEVPRAALAAAGQVMLRVRTSDGVHSAVSEPITVEAAPRATELAIALPADGAVLGTGDRMELRGAGWGPDGKPLADSALVWLVDGTHVGTGASWAYDDVAEGEHTVTLRALDGAGATVAEAERTVTVAIDTDRDGLSDAWEDEHGTDPQDPTDALEDVDRDGLTARDEFLVGTSPHAVDTDSDGYADPVELRGGGDPTDPDSVPTEIHGLDEVPRLTASGEARWPLVVAFGLLIGGGVGFPLSRRKTAKTGTERTAGA